MKLLKVIKSLINSIVSHLLKNWNYDVFRSYENSHWKPYKFWTISRKLLDVKVSQKCLCLKIITPSTSFMNLSGFFKRWRNIFYFARKKRSVLAILFSILCEPNHLYFISYQKTNSSCGNWKELKGIKMIDISSGPQPLKLD